MKKPLDLRRTTIRPLAPHQLARVGGGAYESTACQQTALCYEQTDYRCVTEDTIIAKTYRC